MAEHTIGVASEYAHRVHDQLLISDINATMRLISEVALEQS
jgi:putative aminopeptidase FrvX